MQYCLRYCILSPNRLMHYQRVFSKMRENKRPKINLKALADALNILLGGTLRQEQSEELFELFDLNPECRSLTPDEFCILCAVAERFYYQGNLRTLCEETQQMQQGLLEAADFQRLKMRIENIKIEPTLREFLYRIARPGTPTLNNSSHNYNEYRKMFEKNNKCIRNI